MDGRRIRAARVARGLTLREIGEAMGVTPQAVAQWEKSQPSFDLPKLTKLAQALKVERNWLLQVDGVEDYFNSAKIPGAVPRSPIILRDEAFYHYIYQGLRGDLFANLVSVEPTVHPSGLSFAIVIEHEDANETLREGDICIFDTGLTPRDDDYVILFAVDKGAYRGKFMLRGEITEQIKTVEALLLERDKAYLQRASAPGSVDGVAVVAVLSELRRVRTLSD